MFLDHFIPEELDTSATQQYAHQVPTIGPRRSHAADPGRERTGRWPELQRLSEEQWTATDCTGWTVRDVVVHLVASAQSQASPVEFARQVGPDGR